MNIWKDDWGYNISPNSRRKLKVSVPCEQVYIGTHQFKPKKPIVFTAKDIRIEAPQASSINKIHTLSVHEGEVTKIATCTALKNPIICIYVDRFCVEDIRKSLDIRDDVIAAETDAYGGISFSKAGPYNKRKIIFECYGPLPKNFDGVLQIIYCDVDELQAENAKQMLQPYKDYAKEEHRSTTLLTTTSPEKCKKFFKPLKNLMRRSFNVDRHLRTVADHVQVASTSFNNDKENIEDISEQPNSYHENQLLIYPPGKGGISIKTEDYMCLETDQFLNDIIIDFYLKWIHNNLITKEERDNTFIFSTFFYNRLTTNLSDHNSASDGSNKQTAAQKRHARVAKWTKHVNLFEKDFIIIPINEHSHWFLAIVCFPHLTGPVTYDTMQAVDFKERKHSKTKKRKLFNGNISTSPLPEHDSGNSSPTKPESPQDHKQQTQPIKQPMILIFDSIAGTSRSHVVNMLRDYLTWEYKSKMPANGTSRVFDKKSMPGHSAKVPQQTNYTDCGLYLLQYVEQFYKDPIHDYRVPIEQLNDWFDAIVVTRKREQIAQLINQLINEQQLDGSSSSSEQQQVLLPQIRFPTLNGVLIEPIDNANFEDELVFDKSLNVADR